MSIYFLAPDQDTPIGGVRKLYRQVDILNRSGYSASILHEKPGFRCTWFANATRISYVPEVLGAGGSREDDVLVLPEIHGPGAAGLAPGVSKVIFNQNCFYTFMGFSLDSRDRRSPYLHPEVRAVMVVSEDSREYLEHAFPGLRVARIRNGIDTRLFAPGGPRRRQIAFMLTKNPDDALQVVNILKFRGALDGWELAPIQGRSEAEVARVLRESSVFLSFGTREGFGLPPAEAMACGCVVVGYHGMGGREFFRPEFSYPVPIGDVLSFARTAERVLGEFRSAPERMERMGREAAAFIGDRYSYQAEERDIVDFWDHLLAADDSTAAAPRPALFP